MSKRQVSKDLIEVAIDGKKYVGERIIVGTRTMSQTIYYKGHSKRDNTTYLLGKNSFDMYPVAKMILAEIIFENRLKE
jgi:hypothetical protein